MKEKNKLIKRFISGYPFLFIRRKDRLCDPDDKADQNDDHGADAEEIRSAEGEGHEGRIEHGMAVPDVFCQIPCDVQDHGRNACPHDLEGGGNIEILPEFCVKDTDQGDHEHGRKDGPQDCGQGAGDALHPVADDHRGVDRQGAGRGLGDGRDV